MTNATGSEKKITSIDMMLGIVMGDHKDWWLSYL